MDSFYSGLKQSILDLSTQFQLTGKYLSKWEVAEEEEEIEEETEKLDEKEPSIENSE